jgi:uncharacterized protein YjbJ (UPF0337 family)
MTRLHDKAQGHTKQIIGQMIGDDKLALEGKEDVREADKTEKTEDADDRPAGDDKRK